MALQKSIQELLDKYWAAETSPEEEQQLREALKDSGNSAYAAYFNFLNTEASKTMQSAVKSERQTKVVTLRRALSFAAAVLVLVVAGIAIQQNMIDKVDVATADSYEDPREAYEEAKQALLLVSEKLNSSRELAEEKLEKTQPYIEIIK